MTRRESASQPVDSEAIAKELVGRGDAAPKARFKLTLNGWLGASIAFFWVAVAIVGPWVAPHGLGEFVSVEAFAPPTSENWFGLDYIGRDIFSRVLHGAQLTIGMAFVATLIATTLGTTLGITAAICGGWVDMVMSRLNDALLSFPTIMMGLVIVAALGSSITVLICATGVIYASSVFRIARALAADIGVMDYVTVARGRGEGLGWILMQEVLPNVAVPLLVDFGMRLSFAMLFMSGLSFLGLGVQPPSADWGSLVREGMQGLSAGSWAAIYPAAAIATFSLGLNLVIDDYVASTGRSIARKMK